MSAEIIPFVPRARERKVDDAPLPFRSPARADDLAMDRADTAPCEYSPWCDDQHSGHEPA